MNGLVEIVEFLCLNGADPLFADHSGTSPLDECRKLSETPEAASAVRDMLEAAKQRATTTNGLLHKRAGRNSCVTMIRWLTFNVPFNLE